MEPDDIKTTDADATEPPYIAPEGDDEATSPPSDGEVTDPPTPPTPEEKFPEVETAPSGPAIPTNVAPEMPEMHFAVQHPGYIPAGVKAIGVAGSQTVVRGFIPAGEVAPEAQRDGQCPYCESNFNDKPNPARSLEGHIRSKHRK
jgi:hypothetical protein